MIAPPSARHLKHVLSGLLLCRCGARFEAQNAAYGRRKGGMYVCSAARRKGPAICASDVHLPIADTELLILDAVERDLLDADVFTDALTIAVQRVRTPTADNAALTAEREHLDRELSNLATAIAAGGQLAALVSEMQTRQKRRDDIAAPRPTGF